MVLPVLFWIIRTSLYNPQGGGGANELCYCIMVSQLYLALLCMDKKLLPLPAQCPLFQRAFNENIDNGLTQHFDGNWGTQTSEWA